MKRISIFIGVIPPELTSIASLTSCANKPFKDSIKIKYRDFCIKWQNTKKLNPENLIQWVVDVW